MKETIQSIIEWHSKTFPDATLNGQVSKFSEELSEFNETQNTSMEELVDMFIVACGIARFCATKAMLFFGKVEQHLLAAGFDAKAFEETIHKKMQENRSREWSTTKDGEYHHV